MSNILPKKSWHVLNADNREKVIKDEEAAEEANKAKREAHAQHVPKERMSRLEELRRRSGSQKHHSEVQHMTQQLQNKQATYDDWRPKERPSESDCYSSRQGEAEKSPFRRAPRPWYECPVNAWHADQEADLAREDPLTLFKKKPTRPSSSSYMAVQKAKERGVQKPRSK